MDHVLIEVAEEDANINSCNIKISRNQLNATLWSLLFFVVSMYLVSVANSASDDLNPNSQLPQSHRQILLDPVVKSLQHVFHSFQRYPHYNDNDIVTEDINVDDISFVPEIFILTSILCWIARMLLMPSVAMGLTFLRRQLWICGLVYILRAGCVLMTILPYPLVSCEPDKSPETSPWLDGLLILFMQRRSCGDVFFSGHAIVYVMNMFAWITYPYRYYIITVTFMIIQCLLGSMSLLVVSYHYSIDVFVSFCFTFGIWFIYHSGLAPSESSTSKQWSKVVTWMDGDYSHVNVI